MTENEISFDIRGAAFKVHTNLGPGLLESVYEIALAHELRKMGHEVKSQVGLPFVYDDLKLETGYRIDLLVDDLVIVEIKSIDALADVHHKQLLTYLKLSGKKLGLLINFNVALLKEAIVRIVNNL
jgi:GxxExxY protein